MRKVVIPPYVPSPDGIRCGQSVIMMLLKHFLPEQEWTFADADKICSYVEGKSTWTSVYLLGMVEKGFDIVAYSSFDRERFIASPEEYLFERMGEAKAKSTIDNIDMKLVLQAERRIMTEKGYCRVQRDWQWSDVAELLDQGYLLGVWVDCRKLYSRGGDIVSGHFVLIFDYDAEFKSVTFHDPGGYSPYTDGSSAHTNAWQSGRVGLDHFMNAAKNLGAEGGSSLIGFRLRKEN